MGKLLNSYKEAIINDVKISIQEELSRYYAFAANPIEYTGNTPAISNSDYGTSFINNWYMLFGKKISNSDIVPVISNNPWTANTIYDRYDNTSNTLYVDNNYYVVTEPQEVGGLYHIYKCIDNNNNSNSTIDPSSIGTPTQETTFETGDGYKWRYITSISTFNYSKFATNDYVPVYVNTSIQAASGNNSGVEIVEISNTGSGYNAYNDGTILSNPNSTLVQISSNAASTNFFYNNNSIYIYNNVVSISQLLIVNNYISNASGNWVYLKTPANTSSITDSVTQYKISPQVYFETDGTTEPAAYSVVNTSSNSISEIIILDKGSNISWANVSIFSSYGSGSNLYATINPPGGHGSNPLSELNVKGFGKSFTFSNTESNTIPTSNTLYNKIGMVKNPYSLQSNGSKGSIFTSNTFNNLLEANVSPAHTFTPGEIVFGANSGARGVVVISNSTYVHITGDKNFLNGEYLSNTTSNNITAITINDIGDIYTKDLVHFYIENINNVNRANTQSESYKLIITI